MKTLQTQRLMNIKYMNTDWIPMVSVVDFIPLGL
jgi:hypothetical protein